MTNSKKKAANWILMGIAMLWVLGIAVGSWAMMRHGYTSAPADFAPARWPAELDWLRPNEDRLTVVMSVHPECPCTRASLEQLDRFLTRHPGKVEAIALFFADDATPVESLASNGYWRRLEKIPSARPIRDLDGRLARGFGAGASGFAVAYDSAGRLRFQGGLTPSRGHEGSIYALDALNEIVSEGASLEIRVSPIFGCSLGEQS